LREKWLGGRGERVRARGERREKARPDRMEVRERGKEIINNKSDIVFFKPAESYSSSLAVKNYCCV
jgi:hypothetical protein